MNETRKKEAKEAKTTRLLTICDPHLSAYDPPVYKESYWTTTKNTLNQLFDFAIKKRIDAIIWAGDIFHLKSAARNPPWFLTEVLNLMRRPLDAGIEMVTVAGNHDIKYGSIDKGLTNQPLDVLLAAGVLTLLDRKELVITGKTTTRVTGASYRHGRAEEARDKRKQHAAEVLVTVGHFWFAPATGTFFGEPTFGPEFFKDSQADVFVIGHHHEDQGVQREHGKVFVAHGSMSRTGAHKHDIDRRPAAGLIEISEEGIETTVIRPKIQEAKDLMDLERREQVLQEKEEMTEFISSLQGANFTAADPKEILRETEAAEEVKRRALNYIEAAEEATT